jgi:hypothetical protein
LLTQRGGRTSGKFSSKTSLTPSASSGRMGKVWIITASLSAATGPARPDRHCLGPATQWPLRLPDRIVPARPASILRWSYKERNGTPFSRKC